MVTWYSVSRDSSPYENVRKNQLIFDFRSDESIGGHPLSNAIDAVNRLVSTHQPPYTLMISGGVDSQVMLCAWKLSGQPFRAIHYSYGSNLSDTSTAVEYCSKHAINLDIRHFDAYSFITSEKLQTEAIKYDCTSPQILTHIQMIKNHPETVVMAGNFVQLEACGLNWTVMGLQRFANQEKSNFVPFFLQSTPKLAYSFFYKDTALKLELFRQGRIKDDYETKIECYKSAGFPIIRQASKMTGFEEIKASFDNVKIPFKTRLKWAKMASKRPFDILYRYSLHDVVGYYADAFRIIHHQDINIEVPQP